MKLSDNTVKVLKNFSTINQGIIVKPGKLLRTISPNKAVLAEATVAEKFPHEFGIYDLNKALSLLSMSTDNEVDIGKEFLEFNSLSGRAKIRQRFTSPTLILAPPERRVLADTFEAQFTLSAETLNFLFSAANVLKCPNIVIRGESEDNGVSLTATDVKGQIVDDASIDVDGAFDAPFNVAIKVENLKIIPDNYQVMISSRGVCKFVNEDESLLYWIALEQGFSKFGE